jgi:Methyltransferase domain
MECLGPLYMRLCPGVVSFSRQELADCNTVLDLGCGHRSLLEVCNIPFTVGVDLFEPFLQESRRTGIHTDYVLADLRTVAFRPKSFDAVIAAEVLEHLTREEGAMLLQRMEEWARKKVIVTTPNGFLEQDAYEDNPLQEHQSGWNSEELGRLGYRVRGGAGWKKLRTAKFSPRYQPAFLWERVSDLTQIVTYRWPKLAYQLMAVKQVGRPTVRRRNESP